MSNQTQISSVYKQVNLHAQIEGANAHELIDLLFKGAIDGLARVKGHILQKNIAAKGQEVSKVIGIVAELQHDLTLGEHSEISESLSSLYTYITEILLDANINNDIDKFDEVAFLIKHIRESWNMIPHDLRY